MSDLVTRMQAHLAEAGLAPLPPAAAQQCASYASLFIRWNSRINLSAIRDEDEVIRRHLVECIAVAQVLPESVSSLLDYGSGGGLPGIPIALCRPHLHVTLAESQNKKAAFLREVVRTLPLPDVTVHAQRAELLVERFDCVILRAVDHMERAVASAATLVRSGGLLALMTTAAQHVNQQASAGAAFAWSSPHRLPNSEQGMLVLGRHTP